MTIGSGGAAATLDSIDSVSGNPGGATSFVSGPTIFRIPGGLRGSKGTATNGPGAVPGRGSFQAPLVLRHPRRAVLATAPVQPTEWPELATLVVASPQRMCPETVATAAVAHVQPRR